MAKAKMKATRYPGVYRLEDGRFAIRAVARNWDGVQINRTVTLTTLDELEARDEANRLKAAVDALAAGGHEGSQALPPIRQRDMTVNDFAASWFEAKATTIKPSVAAQYEGCLSKFLPLLGDRQIRDITRRDIEEWTGWAQSQVMTRTRKVEVGGKIVVETYTEPYSQDTLRAWWRVLGLMMRDAMADLDLDRDPMLRVKPPKVNVKPKRERGTLSREQVQDLLDAALQYSPSRHAEIATMVLTGMRAGEVYALRFDDIDFEKESVDVSRAVWKGEEGTTKTEDPRIVPLHPKLAEVLQDQRRSLIRKQHRGLKSGLVFPSDTGGHRNANSLYDALELAVEAAKIDLHVTPQVLRRTFNTLMMLAGTDRIALRAIMGHTSEEMTRRYSGVGLDVKRAAVTKLFGE